MKATARVTKKCDGFRQGETYPVLELSTHAMRITIGHRTKVVARMYFDIEQESGDPKELINKL